MMTEKSATSLADSIQKLYAYYIDNHTHANIKVPKYISDSDTWFLPVDSVVKGIYKEWRGVYGSVEKSKPKPPHCKWCVCEECDPRVEGR